MPLETDPLLSRARPEGALGPYLRALSARRLLVALITLTVVGAAVAWLAVRAPVYEAEAQLLVTPIPQDDPTFLGIRVLRDSPSEPTRAIQTAASLAESPTAARNAGKRLGRGYTQRRVEDAVDVEPQGQTNVLLIRARAPDDSTAADLANAYAAGTLDARRAELAGEVAAALTRARAQLDNVPPESTERQELVQQVSQLEAVADGADPTLSPLEAAEPPRSPVGAPPWLVLLLAAVAGLTLATAAALIVETVDRRIRDEDELLTIFPLPVLVRVPLVRRLARSRDASPLAMPPAVREAFRTLQVLLTQRARSSRVVMVTSGSTGDGKTSAALNLALSLVGGGASVILIDFDIRKPDASRLAGVGTNSGPPRGLVSLLHSDSPGGLAELLTPYPELPPLRIVPAGTEGDVVLLEPLARRLPEILAEAKSLVDYVVIDTPPLGEVSDALRMAPHVDDILVVTRLGHTNRTNLEIARDLLGRSGYQPTGFIVIAELETTSAYHTYGLPQRATGASGAAASRSARS
ncbi:MAG: hypothetical protein M3N16_07450 [Actinomycetota bacterium]|nr:hypothetical protein [Actinomycetota bacterium]